jgi:hypothetical protein
MERHAENWRVTMKRLDISFAMRIASEHLSYRSHRRASRSACRPNTPGTSSPI